MSADGSDYGFAEVRAQAPVIGLQGIEELVASQGLEILRGKIDQGEIRALMDLARIVAEHEAASKAAT